MHSTQDSPLGAGGGYELLGPPVLSVASWLPLKLARRSTNSQTRCKAPGQREALAPVGRLTGHRGLGLAPLRGCLFLLIQTGGEMMDGLKRRGLEPQAEMGWRTDQWQNLQEINGDHLNGGAALRGPGSGWLGSPEPVIHCPAPREESSSGWRPSALSHPTPSLGSPRRLPYCPPHPCPGCALFRS